MRIATISAFYIAMMGGLLLSLPIAALTLIRGETKRLRRNVNGFNEAMEEIKVKARGENLPAKIRSDQ